MLQFQGGLDRDAIALRYSLVMQYNLVGGFNLSEKYQSIGMMIPNIMEK